MARPTVTSNSGLQNINLDDVWDDLEKGINQIYKREEMATPRFLQLYTHVYNYFTSVHQQPQLRESAASTSRIVRHQQQQPVSRGAQLVGLDLYNRIKSFLENHVKQIESKMVDLNREDLFTFYAKGWENYQFCSLVLNGVCAYLNRHWVRRECEEGRRNIYEIYQLALIIWRVSLFQKFNTQVTYTMLQLIENERNGDTFDSSLVSKVISCYIAIAFNDQDHPYEREPNLSVYKECFENKFLEETKQFYTCESNTFFVKNSVTEYMKQTEKRLVDEKRREQQYLYNSTNSPLVSRCFDALVLNHFEAIRIEFQNLLKSEKNDDCAQIFKVMSYYRNCSEQLKIIIENYISNYVKQTDDKLYGDGNNDPKIYIKSIAKIYMMLNILAVNNDKKLFSEAHEKYNELFNSNYRTPEFLAGYCDSFLKKGAQNLDETELEDELNKIIIILKHIIDKDVFQEFYSKMLAKRLIFRLSVSDDVEAAMIAKLKSEFGNTEYTNKLHRMFQDIKNSNEMNEQFIKENQIDFKIQVLTTGSWPTFAQNIPLILPIELQQSVQNFIDFYSKLHEGRKLNWMHKMCKGEIVTNCFKNRYFFQANTHQIAVLLQYNNQIKWTMQQLIDNTGISCDYMQQIIRSLLKARILEVKGEESQLQPDTEISLFLGYKNKKLRVNIDFPFKSEQKVEQEMMNKHIEEDRKILIQATIVRIMKMRKVLNHTQLVTEVLDQLSKSFNPKVQIIKKCIDILIEKEYIQRVEGQNDVYSYVA